MKISIAIPTYKYNEHCLLYLEELLGSIYKQDYSNYEVIISDHTKNDDYSDIINKYKSLMDLKYFKNNECIGNISHNTNNAIKKCTGDIIKVMHQDDSFYLEDTLTKIFIELDKNPDKNWGACGFTHKFMKDNLIKNSMIPSLEKTIGCPSVSFFRRNIEEPDLYDENIYLLLDKDFHDELFKKYKYPLIIEDICILIRMHDENSQFKLESERSSDLLKIKNKNKI